MTSLDKLLYEASQGNYPTIEGGVDIDTLRLTDKQIDGVTIVTDADGKIKVADDFVGDGNGGINLPIEIVNVTGLQDSLDKTKDYIDSEVVKLTTSSEGKYSKVAHKHEITDVNDLQVELDKKVLKTEFNNLKNNFDTHIHEIADVTDLQSTLDQKAPHSHTHNWTQITNRPTSTSIQIDNAVADSHTHANKPVLDDLEDEIGRAHV